MYGEPNRVSKAVETLRARIASGEVSEENRAKCDEGMALEGSEHFDFQQAQTHAHAAGILTTDEAQLVYMALGEVGDASNGGWSAGTDTATKVVVTKLVSELLAARIGARIAS